MSTRAVLLSLSSSMGLALALACGDAATSTPDRSTPDGGVTASSPDGGSPEDSGALASEDGGQSTKADTGFNADAACASSSAKASLTARPVDIVVLVDNSSSMGAEIKRVNDNLNELSTIVGQSNIDYRVVMISLKGTNTKTSPFEVCIKPPLAGSSCADTARFRHIDVEVHSRDALKLITSTYDHADPAVRWKDFIRVDSQKAFLVITDDDSTISANAFETSLFALAPADAFKGYAFHAICGYYDKTECPTLYKVGAVYLDLVKRTGGEKARICESDWKAIFTKMAQAVVKTSTLSCELQVPSPPPGKTLSTSKVSVVFSPGGGGAPVTIERVPTAADCVAGTPGYYFDSNTKPTKIILCPKTCPTVQGDPDGKLDVLFACGGGPA